MNYAGIISYLKYSKLLMLSMTMLTMHTLMHCLYIFKPSIVGDSWNPKENYTKNKCIVKKRSFQKTLFWNPVLLHIRLWHDTALVCHCWQNGRYFYKTHLATLPGKLATFYVFDETRSDKMIFRYGCEVTQKQNGRCYMFSIILAQTLPPI